ncbi:MAG: arginine--tRNA ligase, partial [Patescibacteria group bacterium]
DPTTLKLRRAKAVIVEYSSPNIAKPMHVGHFRGTIIGDCLANVHKFLGYKVIRWNYIGDWGTQFGKLIAAYKMWGNERDLKDNPIKTMLDLYVRFHEELKTEPSLEERGREEFQKLEKGDAENKALWKMFRSYSIDEFDASFKRLGINFDITKGESDYESKIKDVFKLAEDAEILKKSEGADIIEINGLPPALLRKSDGASLYITRDIASLKDRLDSYNPEKILYVVANQQALHFEQLFAIAKKLGWTEVELQHVKFGMVLGEDGKKLATREGKVIPLQEVIDKITALARKVVTQKNSALSEEEISAIAQTVGIGALKYNDLKQHPYSDITFDWEAMLNFTGNSGPYLQYTYARLMSILTKSENRASEKANAALLEDPKEQKIMKQILEFPEAIEKCAELHTLNGLALYLYELANDTNSFYESIRILSDENIERRNARLMLVETVASILERGLGLLGISVLKKI